MGFPVWSVSPAVEAALGAASGEKAVVCCFIFVAHIDEAKCVFSSIAPGAALHSQTSRTCFELQSDIPFYDAS